MRIVVTIDDIRAYAEVDYIIHHMNQRYIDMLPFKLLNFFDKFKDPEWDVYVDPRVPLQNQGLMKYSLEIIAVLHVKYWCTNEKRRQELLKKMQENQNRSDEALRAKYNVENIFATQSVTSVVTENDLIDIAEESNEGDDVTDFSKPRKATVIDTKAVPKAPKVEEKEEEVKEEPEEKKEELPTNFRQPINGKDEFDATDILNSSTSIDNLPIETDSQKKQPWYKRFLAIFGIGRK